MRYSTVLFLALVCLLVAGEAVAERCAACKNDDNCTRGQIGEPGFCGSAIEGCHGWAEGQCASCSCTTVGGCACNCVAESEVCNPTGKINLNVVFAKSEYHSFNPVGLVDQMVLLGSGWTIVDQMTASNECTASWDDKTFEELIDSLASCWGGCAEIDDPNSLIVFKDAGLCN